MSINEPKLSFFDRTHLEEAVRLGEAENWPHGFQDWALALSLSQGVVALQGERVVGTALATKFGDVFMLNMIIVAAAYRGRGLGKRMISTALKYVGGSEARLFATEDGKPLYEKFGFVTEKRNFRNEGVVSATTAELDVSTNEPSFDFLVQMDFAATGMSRSGLLQELVDRGTVFVAEGGFAILRKFGRGYLVGPIVAQQRETARALLGRASQEVDGQFLRLDTTDPLISEFARDALNLSDVGGGEQMVRAPRKRRQGDYASFGLVSQAFG